MFWDCFCAICGAVLALFITVNVITLLSVGPAEMAEAYMGMIKTCTGEFRKLWKRKENIEAWNRRANDADGVGMDNY